MILFLSPAIFCKGQDCWNVFALQHPRSTLRRHTLVCKRNRLHMFTASFLILAVSVAKEWINVVPFRSSNAAVIPMYKMHSFWITASSYLERENCYINRKKTLCAVIFCYRFTQPLPRKVKASKKTDTKTEKKVDTSVFDQFHTSITERNMFAK